VEPANLTVHVSALRRTLRDGRDGNRFIINVPGRGYSFVASVAVGA
jgi:DNA-binding winged helix-turn-helix (wHTH) protein